MDMVPTENPSNIKQILNGIWSWIYNNPAIVRSLLVSILAAVGINVASDDVDTITTLVVLLAGAGTGVAIRPAVTPVEMAKNDAALAFHQGVGVAEATMRAVPDSEAPSKASDAS